MSYNSSNTPNRGHYPALALVAATVVAAGCASNNASTAPVPVPHAADSEPPPAVNLSAQSASVGVSPRAVFRSRGDGPPAYLLIERSPPAPDTTGTTSWIVRRAVGPTPDGPWSPSTEQTFILTPEGDAAIAGETNREEQVELVFSPPMVVMPAHLPADATPFTQQTRLRVYPLGNRKRIKAEGEVRQRIVHEGGAFVESGDTPLGAQRITQFFEAALTPAEVRNTTRQWLIPGTGLVAEEREERTRVFGVPTRSNRESWVILPSP